MASFTVRTVKAEVDVYVEGTLLVSFNFDAHIELISASNEGINMFYEDGCTDTGIRYHGRYRFNVLVWVSWANR